MNLLAVTFAGLVIRGPHTVTLDVATTQALGFRSGDLPAWFGVERSWLEDTHTDQQYGLWNGLTFAVPDGAVVVLPPSCFPISQRWRLDVGGAQLTPVYGVVGWEPLDQNFDGSVDGIDYDLFTNRFVDGDERSDFNADGFVDGMDADAFENEWSQR